MLTLIRHAQSAANAGLATHDPATIDLTPAGHLHAKQLAQSAFASWATKFKARAPLPLPSGGACSQSQSDDAVDPATLHRQLALQVESECSTLRANVAGTRILDSRQQ